MRLRHPMPATHPIHTVHRVGALLLGGFLLVFGVVGLFSGAAFMSTFGTTVFGLSTNGLLAAVSIVVGLLLLGAAVRGGPAASTTLVVLGVLFVISGLVNVFTLGTSMNILAFGVANVVFSLLVGCVLLLIGAYGRFTGRLPADSPYAGEQRGPDPQPPVSFGAVDQELADAERAVATHTATPEQARRVRAASAFRTPEDRRQAFLDAR